MVTADVDNDLFHGGETIDRGDGVAKLAYRVMSPYTGLDSTRGLSAGLKHFGKRRLGQSGLDDPKDVADHAWDGECSQFFQDIDGIHSAYFEVVKT